MQDALFFQNIQPPPPPFKKKKKEMAAIFFLSFFAVYGLPQWHGSKGYLVTPPCNSTTDSIHVMMSPVRWDRQEAWLLISWGVRTRDHSCRSDISPTNAWVASNFPPRVSCITDKKKQQIISVCSYSIVPFAVLFAQNTINNAIERPFMAYCIMWYFLPAPTTLPLHCLADKTKMACNIPIPNDKT